MKKLIDAAAFLTWICLSIIFLALLPIGLFIHLCGENIAKDDEMHWGLADREVTIYENGSVKCGNEDIPLYRVRVGFNLYNRGRQGSVKVVVALSYYDLKHHEGGFLKLCQAAPDQEFEVFLDAPQNMTEPWMDRVPTEKHVEVDFDTSHLAQMIHDGDTHPSVFVASISPTHSDDHP